MGNCPVCNKPFTFKDKYQLTKAKTSICPHCKSQLKATTASKLLFILLFILPIFYFISMVSSEWNSILKWSTVLIWLVFSFFMVQPIIYRYEKS
ncbi:hypothetical protein PJ311_10465 [Bacillus sp. CLL-7-23]|uniref:Cxxc_20_cxxc protein n=1 Tax=Bacillus changyiensis TaxID=3004103 RepID=A0ABT4X447_9BACI|nr:hypothetical protein [Bacillus changyiensis]MDA7027031.1 hypothetical protein [Bacillus changyiensis]